MYAIRSYYVGYIPMPVTLGFTMGIGIVIATLQIKDFFGLSLSQMPEHYVDKLQALWLALPSWQGGDTLVGGVTLATLLIWPRLRLPFPGHLPAVLLGWGTAYLLAGQGIEVATIGTRFSYTLADGAIGHGIPSSLPSFALPWNLPGPDGQPLHCVITSYSIHYTKLYEEHSFRKAGPAVQKP